MLSSVTRRHVNHIRSNVLEESVAKHLHSGKNQLARNSLSSI
jgi:hypothetical protein